MKLRFAFKIKITPLAMATASLTLAVVSLICMVLSHWVFAGEVVFRVIVFGLSIVTALSFGAQWLIQKDNKGLPLWNAIVWVFIAGIDYCIWHQIHLI